MSQHDFNVANGSGAAVRADLNSALGALVTMNSGATEPLVMFANMLWFDTSTDILKLRNPGNTAWINFAKISSTLFAALFSRSAPVTKTADFTLADGEDDIINNKTGSACVVTLGAASDYTGRSVWIKTIQAQAVNSASSNVVPLAGGAAGTAILTGTAGKWARLKSDGNNWVIMAGN